MVNQPYSRVYEKFQKVKMLFESETYNKPIEHKQRRISDAFEGKYVEYKSKEDKKSSMK